MGLKDVRYSPAFDLALIAVEQFDESKLTGGDVVISFDGGGGGSQQHFGIVQAGKHQ